MNSYLANFIVLVYFMLQLHFLPAFLLHVSFMAQLAVSQVIQSQSLVILELLILDSMAALGVTHFPAT